MRKDIEDLINSQITGYQIHKATGISQSLISELRLGKRTIDNLSFKNAEKLATYYNKIKNNQP